MTENIYAVPAGDTVFQFGVLHFSYGPRLMVGTEVGPVPEGAAPNIWSLYTFSGAQKRWQSCRDFNTLEELMAYIDAIRIPVPGNEWKHRNGNTYIVQASANQFPHSGETKYERTVVYRSPAGDYYTRPLWDWHRSMDQVDETESARKVITTFLNDNNEFAYDRYVAKELDGDFATDLARILTEKGILL